CGRRRHPPSFPTRRSSDLVYVDTSRHTEDTPHERHLTAVALARDLDRQGADEATCRAVREALDELQHASEPNGRALFARAGEVRSEEHTSELQSLAYLVCR